jgi:hypothetical protein
MNQKTPAGRSAFCYVAILCPLLAPAAPAVFSEASKCPLGAVAVDGYCDRAVETFAQRDVLIGRVRQAVQDCWQFQIDPYDPGS